MEDKKEHYSKIVPSYFNTDPKSILSDNRNEIIYSKNNIISFNENLIRLTKDLVVPKNKELIVRSGQEIFLDNASIISYGSVKFNGTKSKPIRIYSEKNKKSAILLSNSSDINIFKNVKFEKLSSKIKEDYLTGAITIYKSEVLFENCTFDENFSEDFLNIVESKFLIKYSLFKNSKFDMLDSDFSNGSVINSKFLNSGNDALDFSGSKVELIDLKINLSGDKAISIGEKSELMINNINIDNSVTGIAVKDESKVKILKTKISNSNTGISSYIKKKYYKNSNIMLNEILFEDNMYNVVNSDFSKIYIDGQQLNDYDKKIR